MTQTIAFIGFGEAGQALASGLVGEGAAIAGVYDRRLDEAGTAPPL